MKPEMSRSPGIRPAFCAVEYTTGPRRPTSRMSCAGEKTDLRLLRLPGLRCSRAEPGAQGCWRGIQLLSTQCVCAQCQGGKPSPGGGSVRPSQVQGGFSCRPGLLLFSVRSSASCMSQWASEAWTAGLEGEAGKHQHSPTPLPTPTSLPPPPRPPTPPSLRQDSNSREPNSHASRLQLQIYLAPECTFKCAHFCSH